MSSTKSANSNLETKETTHGALLGDNIRRLGDLKVFKISHNFYKSWKEKAVIGKGICVFEKGADLVSGPVTKTASVISRFLPPKASLVTTKAVEVLEYLDNSCAKFFESANKTKKQLETKTKNHLDNSLSRIVQSKPVSAALLGGDILINIMETVINMVSSDKSTQCGFGKDVKPKSSQGKSSIEIAGRPKQSIERLAVSRPSFIGKVSLIVIKPFQFLLNCLKYIRSKFIPYETNRTIGTMTPARLSTLAKRRKLSPKKRLSNRSFLNRFITHALGFLGVRKVSRFPTHQMSIAAAASRIESTGTDIEGAEKRRHSDVSGDSDVSDTELDYLQDSFEEYVSEEDPDFVPSEEPIEDSFEFEEGDSESFIECRDDENGSPVKLILSSPGKIATRGSVKKNDNKDQKKDAQTRGKENKGKSSDKPAATVDKLPILKEETESKTQKKELKVIISKTEKKTENKENEQPKPKASPNKAVPVLRPQNTSSPILKPEWKKTPSNNKENKPQTISS